MALWLHLGSSFSELHADISAPFLSSFADEWESASEDEDMDDDSEGWIDVYHSSDEEQEKKEETPQEMENKKKLAQEVSSTRILSQEDFRRLQQAQLTKEAGLKTASQSKKRKQQADTSQDR